jgi:hypothetical protein
MRHSYQAVWVPKLVPRTEQEMSELRAGITRRNVPKDNPAWVALRDGSYIAPEGSRVVTVQACAHAPSGLAVFDPYQDYAGEGLLLLLECEHNGAPDAVAQISTSSPTPIGRIAQCALVIGYDIDQADTYVIKDRNGPTGRVSYAHAMKKLALAKLSAEVKAEAQEQEGLDEERA